MKILEIKNSVCFSDLTRASLYHDLSKIPNLLYVEAPDYVFPGWGYDCEKNGDERFIKPVAPEGWGYDDNSGTFYPLNPSEPEPTPQEDTDAMLVDHEYRITLLELGV